MPSPAIRKTLVLWFSILILGALMQHLLPATVNHSWITVYALCVAVMYCWFRELCVCINNACTRILGD